MPHRPSTELPDADHLPAPPAAPERAPRPHRRRQAVATARRLGGVAAAAAVGIAALSGCGATLEPTPVGPASAGSTTAPDPTPTAAPTTAPAPEAPPTPPAEGAGELVQDGRDRGFLRAVTDGPDGPTVVLDRAVLLTGDEADAEAEARGLESPVPNDVLVLNDVPRLREYPVSPDAEVTLTVGLTDEEPTDGGVESTLSELRSLLPPGSDQPVEPVSGYLFDVVVSDGVVVALDHVYLP